MSTPPKPVSGLPGTTRDFASNLVLASRMITASRDFTDMALGVIYTLAQSLTAVGISLFDADAVGERRSRQVVALVTVEGAAAFESLPRTDLLPSPAQTEILRRGLPILPELAQAGETTRSELAALGVTWAASFALRTGDEVLGTLDIFHTQPCTLTTEEIDAYTVLADQIGVAARNRALFGQMQAALDETRALYEINRAILSAQDTQDILHTLRQHFAPDAVMISHLTAGYDGHDRMQRLTIDFVSLPAEEQAVIIALDDLLGAEQMARLQTLWSTYTGSVTLVEDLDAPGITDPLADVMRQRGVRSYAAIMLRERDLVREAISVGFDRAQVFDDRQRRLYAALADQISIVLQNHRLLRESQISARELSKQVRLLQIINQLALTISSTQDEKTLLDTSCRALVEATGIDHCSIALITPSATASQVASEYPARGTVGVQIPLADNAVYQIVRDTRQPLIVSDINSDSRLPPASQHLLQRMGVRAMLVIPLFVYDDLVGSIGMDVLAADKTITLDIVDTSLAVSAQVGLGLQNVRLLAEAQRRADQLQRITAFSQSAQATLDLPTLFNNMLLESAQMLAQDQMSISLYDSPRDALRVVAQHTAGITSVSPTDGDLIPISGQIAAVWNSREMLHIPDVHQLRDHPDPDSDVRSWLLAPIVVRGQALGLVSVGSTRPYLYTEADVALFQQMVTQLAVAIENTEAYSQSQRMVKNESLLNAISTQLQSQTDLEHMMSAAVNELGKAIGARRARIRLGTPDNRL